jgi:hypothetical protein
MLRVVMISRTECQKIAVETPNENVQIELDKSIFLSFVRVSDRLQGALKKDDFD